MNKLLCNICCAFIIKKRNRKHFRKKYINRSIFEIIFLSDDVINLLNNKTTTNNRERERERDVFVKLNKNIKTIKNSGKFQQAIISSSWLKYQNFMPGRWAMDNLGLFTIFYILNNMRPKNILEFGLGQSSKLVHQYAIYTNNKAKTIEHDAEWVDFFTKEIVYNINVELHELDNIEINNVKTLTYKDIDKLMQVKYDFILVDGPFGQERFSRPAILEFVKADLPERFCILIDDTERNGEKETIAMLEDLLKEQKRNYLIKKYNGEKNSHSIVCSMDLKFLTTQ